MCNHPELFERADVESPFAFCDFGESGPLQKEQSLEYCYSTRNKIKFHLPKQVYRDGGLIRVPGSKSNAGFTTRYLDNLMNIWDSDYIHRSMESSEQGKASSRVMICMRETYLFCHRCRLLLLTVCGYKRPWSKLSIPTLFNIQMALPFVPKGSACPKAVLQERWKPKVPKKKKKERDGCRSICLTLHNPSL